MKMSHLLVLGVVLLNLLTGTESIFLSLFGLGGAAVGLAGLAGLKLYLGMKVLGAATRAVPLAPTGPAVQTTGVATSRTNGGLMATIMKTLGGGAIQGTHSSTLKPDGGKQEVRQPIMILPIAVSPNGNISNAVPISIRVKRASSSSPVGLQLNPKLFDFLRSMDDDRCFERFFCELGSNSEVFGKFGNNVEMMMLFSRPPGDSWYMRAYNLGKKGKTSDVCPTKCNSRELHKMVRFVEKQIFA